MHDGALKIDLPSARSLIADAFPALADERLEPLPGGGTVHTIVRVGESYAARFRLLDGDPDVVRAELTDEAAAAAAFAQRSTVPAPVPLGIGAPGHGYPLPWSMQTWVPGTIGTPTGSAAADGLAQDLADLVLVLRRAPTGGRTFAGTGRGGDLRDHDGWVATCVARSAGIVDAPAAAALWSRLRHLPAAGPDVMSHGDLIPSNLLVAGGRLTGVLDTGGFGPADPALDLVAAWHLFDGPARARFRAALGCGDVEWRRGAAWALEQAMGLVWYYPRTNPPMAALGRSTVRRLLRAEELREPWSGFRRL